MDREQLGRVVREAWVAFKREEVAAGQSVDARHLVPWEELPEREKEIDRRIGEAVARAIQAAPGVHESIYLDSLARSLSGRKFDISR